MYRIGQKSAEKDRKDTESQWKTKEQKAQMDPERRA